MVVTSTQFEYIHTHRIACGGRVAAYSSPMLAVIARVVNYRGLMCRERLKFEHSGNTLRDTVQYKNLITLLLFKA